MPVLKVVYTVYLQSTDKKEKTHAHQGGLWGENNRPCMQCFICVNINSTRNTSCWGYDWRSLSTLYLYLHATKDILRIWFWWSLCTLYLYLYARVWLRWMIHMCGCVFCYTCGISPIINSLCLLICIRHWHWQLRHGEKKRTSLLRPLSVVSFRSWPQRDSHGSSLSYASQLCNLWCVQVQLCVAEKRSCTVLSFKPALNELLCVHFYSQKSDVLLSAWHCRPKIGFGSGGVLMHPIGSVRRECDFLPLHFFLSD